MFFLSTLAQKAKKVFTVTVAATKSFFVEVIIFVKEGLNLFFSGAPSSEKKGLRMKIEYNSGNHKLIKVHLSSEITKKDMVTFTHNTSRNKEERTYLVDALLSIKGIKEVAFLPYEIYVIRANLFNWKELLPQIKEVLYLYLAEAK